MGFAKYNEDVVSRHVSDNQRDEYAFRWSTAKKAKKNKPKIKKEKFMALKQFAVQRARPLPVIMNG